MTLQLDIKYIYDTIISPILDFGIIFLIIYGLLRFLRGTLGASVFAGCIIALISLYGLANLLKFRILSWLFAQLGNIAPIALLVLFQSEFRRAFAQLGSTYFPQRSGGMRMETIREIIAAVTQLSKDKTGALIVFERKIGLATIKNNAVGLDSRVQSLLLQSIFFPNSPLHDGALIIRGNDIQAAHAILPLTQNPDYFGRMNIGTRHRAAIGVTEETDAVAVVVSEETGFISFAEKGRLERNLSPDKLCQLLEKNMLDKNVKVEASSASSAPPGGSK